MHINRGPAADDDSDDDDDFDKQQYRPGDDSAEDTDSDSAADALRRSRSTGRTHRKRRKSYVPKKQSKKLRYHILQPQKFADGEHPAGQFRSKLPNEGDVTNEKLL